MSPTPPNFDKFGFRRTIKYVGRTYRKQATELVSISRVFVQAQEQTPDSDARLRVALELVDVALKAAVDAGKKSSKEADKKFSEAIESLKEYEKNYHLDKSADVEARMERAKTNDISSSSALNRLKETFIPMETVPTKNVEFFLQKSLLDASPTTVTQELCRTSNQNELLWNFCRFPVGKGRLPLKQNPHFYTKLPMSPEHYGVGYSSGSILENFFQYEMISVLEDGPGRVYIETAEGRRAFGGVWFANNVIIFKDVQGKLEGENIVGGPFQNTHDLSCFDDSPQSSTKIQDWKEPIRTMLHSQGVDRMVHITANRSSNGSPGDSSPARPRPRSMRDRTPPTIRGTYSKSPNLKQYTSPPQTTSTDVPPSSSASSRPQAATTAAPSSSLAPPPQRRSRTSPPEPACTLVPPSSDSLPPPSTSSVSPRQPVSTAAPPSSVLSQPKASSTSSPRPASTAAPPSSTTSAMPHPPSPQPPPTSAPRVTGVAKSAPPIARPTPAVTLNQEPHGGTLQGAVPDTSRSPISKALSSDRSAATDPSLGIRRTGHEGIDGPTPIQARGHSPQVEHVRTLPPVRASPPPPVQAQAIDSQPKTQPVSKKRNWFQKHVWDYTGSNK